MTILPSSLGRLIIVGLLLGVAPGFAHAERATAQARLHPVRLAPPTERAAPLPPVRAYAISGDTFYYDGQKIQVEGLRPARPDSELAKQRLQQRLDAGPITLTPVGPKVAGLVRARVQVGGESISN